MEGNLECRWLDMDDQLNRTGEDHQGVAVDTGQDQDRVPDPDVDPDPDPGAEADVPGATADPGPGAEVTAKAQADPGHDPEVNPLLVLRTEMTTDNERKIEAVSGLKSLLNLTENSTVSLMTYSCAYKRLILATNALL
mmetsp:Transcript_12841/g.23141  ORF Transcript_12841/g.23141 Transcript_12841/m.23141 type:complete len:138 (+) Transcript_12841:291-704(+)